MKENVTLEIQKKLADVLISIMDIQMTNQESEMKNGGKKIKFII